MICFLLCTTAKIAPTIRLKTLARKAKGKHREDVQGNKRQPSMINSYYGSKDRKTLEFHKEYKCMTDVLYLSDVFVRLLCLQSFKENTHKHHRTPPLGGGPMRVA